MQLSRVGSAGGLARPGEGPKIAIPIDFQLTDKEIREAVMGIEEIKNAVDRLTASVAKCRGEMQGLLRDASMLPGDAGEDNAGT